MFAVLQNAYSPSVTLRAHYLFLQLDPSNVQTVPEILSGRAAAEAEASKSSSAAQKKSKAVPSKANGAAAVNSDDEGDISLQMDLDNDDGTGAPRPISEPTSIAHLHAKLQARIAKLQGNRFGTGANAGFEPGSKEELLEEARIRRGDLRERRRKKTREEKRLEKKQGGKDDGYKKKNTGEDLSVKAGKVSWQSRMHIDVWSNPNKHTNY